MIGYSEEQEAIRRTVRDFARKEIAPEHTKIKIRVDPLHPA